jgi:hypothetical protein
VAPDVAVQARGEGDSTQDRSRFGGYGAGCLTRQERYEDADATLAELRMQVEFAKKAATWFARGKQ